MFQPVIIYDGSTITQITDNSNGEYWPYINDNGYVVWRGCINFFCEILLYDGSTITQLTDNSFREDEPKINNNGYVVWSVDDFDYEIFLYDGSTITQITDNAYDDRYPQINDNGYVVWVRSSDIFLYDGATITQLSDTPYSDYFPKINNNGYVVWDGGTGEGSGIFQGDPCFDPKPLRVNSIEITYYNSLQNAYDLSTDGDTIQSEGIVYSESLYVNRDILILFGGGYDCRYEFTPDETVIDGDLIITYGMMIINDGKLFIGGIP